MTSAFPYHFPFPLGGGGPGAPDPLVFFAVTGNFVAVADPSVTGTLNSPIVVNLNPSPGPPGLVTFTPRLGGKGRLLPVANYLVSPAYNAEQTVNVIGNPTTGTFTLKFGTDAPVTIAYNASASAVQTALNASPSIGAGNVLVSTPQPQAYVIEFTGALGGASIPLLVADGSLLGTAQGVGFCEVTVDQTSQGGPQVVADTAIALAALTAGILDGVLCTLDRDNTPGFELSCNMAAYNLDELIYDVTFSGILANGNPAVLAPFAFTAPLDNTPVVLTDPALPRLAYQPPDPNMWIPTTGGALQLAAVSPWRRREFGIA